MKKAIVPIIFTLVIMSAVYYFLVVKKQKKEQVISEEKTTKMPTEEDLKKLGYNADEIIAIVSSESYKNGTLTNY